MKTILLLGVAVFATGFVSSCTTEVQVPVTAPRSVVTTEETTTTQRTPYGTVQTQTVQSY